MTKIMHMIVISDDLVDFRHVHPVLRPNGHLNIDLKLPERPGGYHIYIDGCRTASVVKVDSVGADVSGGGDNDRLWTGGYLAAHEVASFASVQIADADARDVWIVSLASVVIYPSP